MMSGSVLDGVRRWAVRAGPVLALLGWGALTWRWRPRDPFSPEELAVVLAIDTGAGPVSPAESVTWLLKLVIGDGHRALQAAALLAAAACLWLTWALGRRQAGRGAVGWWAAAGLAAAPGFLFYAVVGLADLLALALLLGAWWAGLAALERPRMMWALAASGAAGVACMPAIWPALAPCVVLVLVSAWRRKSWRELGLAVVLAAAVGMALGAPGLRVREEVVPDARHEVAATRAVPEIPSVRTELALAELGRAWLVRPFGPAGVAGLVWGVVVAGAVAWWRAGHFRLIGMVGGGALAYLLVAMSREPLECSVRLGLPVLPAIALAAAGHLLWPSRLARRGALALVAGAAGFFLWDSSAALATRRRPTPVAAVFEHVAKSVEAKKTHLVIGQDLAQHAAWWLPKVGREGELWKAGHYYFDTTEDGRKVVVVTSEPVAGLRVEYERAWNSSRFRELAGERFTTAVVQIPARGVGSIAMPGLVPGEDSWTLAGQGWLELPEGARPRVCAMCPISAPLAIEYVGQTARELWPGECADVLLLGGPAGRVGLSSSDAAALMQPLEFVSLAGDWRGEASTGGASIRRFPAGLAWVVPVVARLAGASGAEWVTDLVITNQGSVAGEVVVARLPGKRRGNLLPGLTLPLPAGESVRLDDVLARPELADGTAVGGLLVGLDAFNPEADAKLAISARTFNRRGAGGALDGLLVSVPLSRGVLPGEATTLGEVVVAAGERVAVGATAVGASAARTEFIARDRDGKEGARRSLSVPVLGQSQEPWQVPVGRWQITCEVAPGDRGVRIVPYLSQVDGQGRSRYLVGASTTDRVFASAILVNALP